jgi:putative FmdB family regulatory protein
VPIFDYACPSCSSQFERLVPRADTPVDCPKCGKVATKQLSAFAAHSSGGGGGGGDACGCYPSGGG